jgi:hypothetical protein
VGLAAAANLMACAAPSEEEGIPEGELGASMDEVRESIAGPVVKRTDAEVWSVDNQWADKDTAAAKKEGVAWGANSGLTWEEKYGKWIGAFEKVPSKSGWGSTIKIPTPYGGKKLEGPVLECADVAVFLRMTFAAMYHLPFYLTGWTNGRTVYFGHFGVVDGSGNPIAGYPRFKTQYGDYEASWRAGQGWPSDMGLRRKHIGQDDGAEGVGVGDKKLQAGDGAGAYLDELFLNKRAGHLMVILDGMFGSANLADGANMFHIKPEATQPGDALLERWQKNGIGHTLPVMTVDRPTPERMKITLASGSMPRRQPVWDDANQSTYYFTSEETGGEGNAFDGTPFAKLGGGIRRWRTPVATGGRWNNIVPMAFRSVYISDDRIADIAARPARFKELLKQASPEEQRDAAIQAIENARRQLREKPASCSRRSDRENAFKSLYEAMAQLGKDKGEVDAQYRSLEDYVFAELSYNEAKTCCWNSTNAQMADIVIDFAKKEKARNDAAGVCKQPTPFKATRGGYDTWKQHAASLGRAAQWKEWSEDEPCAQRGTAEDALTEAGKTEMCQ